MTHLHQHLFLKCPYSRAKGYLRDALAGAAETHEKQALTLRVPLGQGVGGGALHKDVVATYTPGADPMHFDQPWKIHWTPADGGPYPDFDGELTIRADEDYPTSILELTGQYKPPMGVAGALFDAVAGSRLAEATAQELLKRIGRSMEMQYSSEEEQKSRV
ncbi:MAG: hypothetical protein M3N19_07705 [Candidatus Eremiobacteraeota bacterium]|nr:hypothetical protein [Candidatus Eremiobacteraeota bacterium]